MGHIRVMAGLAAGVLTLSLLASGAQACSCQKEYLIKKYGTLSVLDLPERPEPVPAGTPEPSPPATQPATAPSPAPTGG